MNKVVLPFPDSKLMPNRAHGQHWSVTKRAKDRAWHDAYLLTQQAGWQGVQIEGLKITYYTPDKRKRDTDNLLAASKSALDGFAKAVGLDDSNFNPLLVVRVDGVGKAKARMEVELL